MSDIIWYRDTSDLPSFSFGGVTSSSYNYIFESDHLKSFEKDFELEDVPGRSGSLLIDNKREKNKPVNIEGFIDCEGSEPWVISESVKDWLTGKVEYQDLVFSDDPTEYEAIVVGGVDITEPIDGLLKVKFSFSCKRKEG